MKKLYTLLFLLTFFLPFIKGQESTPLDNKLTYGVYLYTQEDSNYYQPLQLGFNTVVQYAKPGNIDSLLLFENSIPDNKKYANEYISHYSAGYYKKWEAEEDIQDMKSGVKHSFGEVQNISGVDCWVVPEDSQQGDNFIFGPHYQQDKEYRGRDYIDSLRFIVRFRIKLLEPSEALPVCSLRIVFNYKIDPDTTIHSEQFTAVEVNTSQLSTSSFTDIQLTYSYPQEFHLNNSEWRYLDGRAGYNDLDEGTGIQFIVDWLGGPRIAVDYVEVYDDGIWRDYITDPQAAIADITNFANSFPSLTNLAYWHAPEPLCLDAYEPYRRVAEILDSINAKPLITDFHPGWSGEKNGRTTFQLIKDYAQPKQLYVIYLPLWYSDTPNPHENLEWLLGDLLRNRFITNF